MEMTEVQKKFLDKADKKIRQARKDIDIVMSIERKEDKCRRQETADSDECMGTQKL